MLTLKERRELYERMRESIVCICEDTDDLIGGGVFVKVGSRQLVLTAAHVVHKKINLHIVCCDKKSYVVQQLHFDRKRDVALLDVLDKPDDGFKCAPLCETNELIKKSEIHFIGHPGRQPFTYNVGNISCEEKTFFNIWNDVGLVVLPKLQKNDFIDDFRDLRASVRLVQAKNVHGGGRFGGTGAPFLDGDGNIVGLYSFTFQEEDHAIHVADVKASITSFADVKASTSFNRKGKGKKKN